MSSESLNHTLATGIYALNTRPSPVWEESASITIAQEHWN